MGHENTIECFRWTCIIFATRHIELGPFMNCFERKYKTVKQTFTCRNFFDKAVKGKVDIQKGMWKWNCKRMFDPELRDCKALELSHQVKILRSSAFKWQLLPPSLPPPSWRALRHSDYKDLPTFPPLSKVHYWGQFADSSHTMRQFSFSVTMQDIFLEFCEASEAKRFKRRYGQVKCPQTAPQMGRNKMRA